MRITKLNEDFRNVRRGRDVVRHRDSTRPERGSAALHEKHRHAICAGQTRIVPSLFVLNSRGATLQGDTLTLTGVTPSSIIFADRPVRSAGHQPTADVIAEWGSGDDSFTKNPPNATLSVFGKDGSVKDAVVVLKNPKLEGDRLTFNVQTLEGDITGADGGAALFIDIIGRPFTPMSFAGVARRIGISRRDVCWRRRRGCVWGGCVCAPIRLSVCATGVRLLSLSALLLRPRGGMRFPASVDQFGFQSLIERPRKGIRHEIDQTIFRSWSFFKRHGCRFLLRANSTCKGPSVVASGSATNCDRRLRLRLLADHHRGDARADDQRAEGRRA